MVFFSAQWVSVATVAMFGKTKESPPLFGPFIPSSHVFTSEPPPPIPPPHHPPKKKQPRENSRDPETSPRRALLQLMLQLCLDPERHGPIDPESPIRTAGPGDGARKEEEAANKKMKLNFPCRLEIVAIVEQPRSCNRDVAKLTGGMLQCLMCKRKPKETNQLCRSPRFLRHNQQGVAHENIRAQLNSNWQKKGESRRSNREKQHKNLAMYLGIAIGVRIKKNPTFVVSL